MDWHGTQEIKELKAEIAKLRDDFGEALVRENNLRAALTHVRLLLLGEPKNLQALVDYINEALTNA
jgi:hypothetical protein